MQHSKKIEKLLKSEYPNKIKVNVKEGNKKRGFGRR
jgi:rubrerythrin